LVDVLLVVLVYACSCSTMCVISYFGMVVNYVESLYCQLEKCCLGESVTLIDFQLDAQNSYLFINNTLIKILYMFRALPCSFSGGLRRNCIHATIKGESVFVYHIQHNII